MAAWLGVWCLFVVFLNDLFIVDAVNHIKTNCEHGLCLVLYGSEYSDGSDFGDTRRACQGLDQTVAAITDASVQHTVHRLLSGVPGIDGVWTAGIRRQQNDWKYMNGSDFDEVSIISREYGSYCAYMRHREVSSFFGDQCNEFQGNSYPFCQFTRTRSGSCSNQAYNSSMYKDTCYYVHNEQPGDGGWYDAQTFCHTQLGGDLAYRHILDTELMEQLGISRDVWIGITKYQWGWRPNTGVFFPIQYFKWESDFDESRTAGHVAISTGNFTWKNEAATTRLKHFICAYVDEPSTTTVSTTRTDTSGKTHTITTSGSADITTARGENDSGSADITPARGQKDNFKRFPVAAVVGSVCATVLVVTVGLAVLFIIRKKKGKAKQQPRSSHGNANKGASSAKHDTRRDHEPELDYENVQGDAMGAGYSSVGLDQADNTDQITPRGGYKPTEVKEPSTKTPISGVFQKARPTPQGGKKDDKIPEVAIYAQPNKPTKSKNVMDSTRPKKKPTIKTGKPKLGSNKTAQAEVTHVEAPGGDIYAVSTRNVGAKQHSSDAMDVL